ncbi:MAG TPA: hypothetical protein VM888_03920 [Chitinophagaceae bacterium]|jgi:hypothetical protein|nr:hypothetical protein [Chitinophagaceae bacterium]
MAVEKFVEQNPDLGKELDLLRQSILTNDKISFEAKDLLYKKEAGISMVNYEEYFLLSVDNELSREEIEEVERFVLNHPQLQDEFTSLKQTIVQPETIQFPRKQVLYKTEKERRVVPFSLMKVSMAAAVTALVAALWILTQNNNAPISKSNLVTNHQQVNYTKPSTVTQSPKAVIDEAVAIRNKGHRSKNILQQEKKKTFYQAKLKDKVAVTSNNIAVANTTAGLKQNSREDLHENKRAIVQAQKLPEEKLSAAVETGKNLSSSLNSVNQKAGTTTFASRGNIETPKPFAKGAVYNEITNDDDRSIYIGATEINKNKLKGLLKRAAILFDKKLPKSETERTVQIASFEIKSK